MDGDGLLVLLVIPLLPMMKLVLMVMMPPVTIGGVGVASVGWVAGPGVSGPGVGVVISAIVTLVTIHIMVPGVPMVRLRVPVVRLHPLHQWVTRPPVVSVAIIVHRPATQALEILLTKRDLVSLHIMMMSPLTPDPSRHHRWSRAGDVCVGAACSPRPPAAPWSPGS